jgi:hypothetical protein
MQIKIRFEVLTAVSMKIAVFWVVAPYSSERARRFKVTYRLHLQGRSKKASKKPEAGGTLDWFTVT